LSDSQRAEHILIQHLEGLSLADLRKIIPFYVESAEEMHEDEPELFGDKTVQSLAINSFIDNTYDAPRDEILYLYFRSVIREVKNLE